MNNVDKGNLGEKLAVNFLQKNGYKILFTHWTCHWGEIDIIAKKGNTLYFLEVKYRSSEKFGLGYESVNYYKKRKLFRAVNMFLTQKNLHAANWQFDVISITGTTLEHYPNASLT